MQPWQTIDRIETPEGLLELRRRGRRDFLITVAGRVLMTSSAHRSEDALATLACAALARLPRPRLLLGGLGMGFTLRAALDRLPPRAEVTVIDLNPRVVDWCRGPLAPLTDSATGDARVRVEIADVARVIAGAPARRYDAIVLDLYEGPRPAMRGAPFGAADPLYGALAMRRAFDAVSPGGVVAIWSEEADDSFEDRFAATGFEVLRHRDGGRGGRAHVIYIGTRPEA
jgi:spermidine synthase